MTNKQQKVDSITPWSDGCAWIDGELVPIGEARIPIIDAGFTRSDCTYDVVSVWEGNFFRLDDHLERFKASCAAARLQPPCGFDRVKTILFDCVSRSGLRDAYVEMITTRGIAPKGERDPRNYQNRFYAFAIPYVWILRPEQFEHGVALHLAREVTRIDSTAVDPRVKNFQWGDFTRGLFEAYAAGSDNVVLLNERGEVTEGPGFNLFVVVDNSLHTPASGILEGITRRSVLELGERLGLIPTVAPLRPEVLERADEIFLTSTAGGIMPVTRFNGEPLGQGTPGSVTRQLRQAYWDMHTDPHWATPVSY